MGGRVCVSFGFGECFTTRALGCFFTAPEQVKVGYILNPHVSPDVFVVTTAMMSLVASLVFSLLPVPRAHRCSASQGSVYL